ncbi:lytic transglycosylase domain-containing protein [Neotabrizicola shimadae]|uniref:Lytic transglycosylase domain-containing protein n=1 Tax=Neotabrizicola shimadae TaxID=2807096 RepID=A0A8G1EF81_9RHOB|nr:lytic transglycosylase domain-containing protein [Neotabrizicola shimadae]
MRRLAGMTALAFLMVLPGHVSGEALSPANSFTFKRLKPPDATTAKRITVQIDPEEQARLMALPEKKPEEPEPEAKPEDTAAPSVGPADSPPAVSSDYAWFWETVPTALGAVSGRFPLALATLSQGPGGAAVHSPRMQTMQQMADNWGTEILKATIGTEVSPALVLAVMAVESGGRADAVSSAGATGLMQLIPATASRFGVSDSKDPVQNIKGGVAYLDWLMKTFDRDPLMVLAAYNSGEGAVQANQGVPPYAETRDYVPKVLAAWQIASGLCITPPEVVTDPCVFKIISASN